MSSDATPFRLILLGSASEVAFWMPSLRLYGRGKDAPAAVEDLAAELEHWLADSTGSDGWPGAEGFVAQLRKLGSAQLRSRLRVEAASAQDAGASGDSAVERMGDPA